VEFWKWFSPIALLAAVILAVASLVILLRARKHTENNFNAVALWSCASLAAVLLPFLISASTPWELLFEAFGVRAEKPSLSDKALAIIFVLAYCLLMRRWSISWSGLQTQHRFEKIEAGYTPSFFWAGLEETWRLATFKAAPKTYQKYDTGNAVSLRISKPLLDLPYNQQVRSLALAVWREFVIPDDSWSADAICWRGIDKSLGKSILLVCCANFKEIDLNRLRAQILFEQANDRLVRAIFVALQSNGKEEISRRITELNAQFDLFTFDEFVQRALPLSRYRYEIEKEFCSKRLPNSDFAIRDVVAPTTIEEGGYTNIYRGDKTTEDEFDVCMSRWMATPDMRQMALLGDYGQGKSTAALYLTYRLLNDEAFFEKSGSRLPILIRLTGQSPKTSSAEELLDAWGGRLGLDGRALLALHLAGKTIVIFDAFDEMANVSNHSDRLDHFNALWQFACPLGKVLFTGRPNFFLDDEDLKSTLRISDSSASGAYCSVARIKPFSQRQIRAALRWLPEDKVEEFMDAVSEQSALLEIVQRPSLLFQVAQLWYQGQLSIESGSVQSANVILKFVRYSLDRQYEKQIDDVSKVGISGPFIGLRRSELEYFMQGCAVAALTSGRNNSLSSAVFRQTILQLSEHLPDRLFLPRPGDRGSLLLPLVERLPDAEGRIEACENAVRTHGVLELDPTKSDHYKFSHKSFAEALAADVILAAATQRDCAQRATWNVLKPGRELLAQRVIFSFVRDLAVMKSDKERYKSGFLFQGLTGANNRVFAELLLSQLVILTAFLDTAQTVSAANMRTLLTLFQRSSFSVRRDLIQRRVEFDAANLFGEPKANASTTSTMHRVSITFAIAISLFSTTLGAIISNGALSLPFVFFAVVGAWIFAGFSQILAMKTFGVKATLMQIAYIYAYMISSIERFEKVSSQAPAFPYVPTRAKRVDQVIYFVLAST